jgi:hypothetical protein
VTRARDVANIDGVLTTKGDIYAATAAATPARLGVGSNGDTLVADSSTSTGLRYNTPISLANPTINGGMDIWQRGTSISVAAGAGYTYTADRWCMTSSANQATTISRQATGDTTNLPNIQYAMRFQRNSGQTGTAAIYHFSSFESINSIPFAGKTVTMSFYARAGANYSQTSNGLGAGVNTGTGTDQAFFSMTGAAFALTTTVTLTTTWQRFVVTGTIAATATQLAPCFIFTPTGTAGANDYYEVTGVQIDLGTYTASTAPSFRRSQGTIQGELAACQRYYWRNTAFQVAGGSQSAADNNVWFALNTFNAVPMRTSPTAAIESTPYIADFQANLRDIISVNMNSKTVVGFAYSGSKLTTALSYGLNFADAGRALSFNSEL